MNPALFMIITIPILIIITLIIGTVIRIKVEGEYNPGPKLSNKPFVKGKLINIREDESGLSRVIVRKENGHIIYGFSSHSVKDLEQLYEMNSYVSIPIVKSPSGRAYMIDVDYWDQ